MRVESIGIYPIKGCRRVELERSPVEPWGLEGDRRWLIVDAATGVAVTLRDTVALAGITPSIVDGNLVLRSPGRPELTVARPAGADPLAVTVWGYTGPAAQASPEAHEWCSRVLDRDVRLVWCDDPTRRPVNPRYGRESDRVSFADGYPVSLASMASLAALNDLIVADNPDEAAVPITRFRSNIVISGAPAWAEDDWTGRRIRVGDVAFRVAKPNDRCVVTTMDEDSGEKGKEPLRALGRHRNVNQELLFATYLIPDGPGTIAVGDTVTAL